MSNQLILPRLIIQNENSNIIPKKTMISEQKKKPKLGLGKGGSGLGNRKALNDITNKTNIHQETSTKKKISSNKESNFIIAEERFLHDHNKCFEAQQQTMTQSMFLDIVLPGHSSLPLEAPVSQHSKIDHYTPLCYPEPVELEMSELHDWLESPESPLELESPPCSPCAWEFEAVEFFLKPEIDI